MSLNVMFYAITSNHAKKKISFGGIPNSRNVLFLPVEAKRWKPCCTC
jgi:hypothetical protein